MAMFGRTIRVLFGFAVACLATGLTLVLFVYTPAEFASLPSDVSGDRMSEAGLFALVITPHIVVFAALPALVGVIFGEARKIAGWTFYALVGIAIAALGFLTQHFSETSSQVTILQNYALVAFLTSGLVGGLVYRLCSGRVAARQIGPAKPESLQPASPGAPAGGPPPAGVPNSP